MQERSGRVGMIALVESAPLGVGVDWVEQLAAT